MARYLPIAEHGLIGAPHTAALAGTDETIDWYCCPRFDPPSVFAAILHADGGGLFQIAPDCDGAGAGVRSGRRASSSATFPQAFTHLALSSAAYNLDRKLG